MGFLFTSESVSEGHPDKVSDQISDAILDEFLRHDPNSKVACETLCTTGLVVVAGEVRSSAYVDIQHVTRRVINRIGYTKSEYQFDGNSCGVLSAIHEQSPDINQGVVREAEEEQGAGDQGIYMLVIEGRYPDEGIRGTSVNTCADILLAYGCRNAINMDGGSSAILWYDGEYVTQSSSVTLRYTGGRPLPNAWVYG